MGPRARNDRVCISYDDRMSIYPGLPQIYTSCHWVYLRNPCISVPPQLAYLHHTEWWWWETDFSATTASKCISKFSQLASPGAPLIMLKVPSAARLTVSIYIERLRYYMSYYDVANLVTVTKIDMIDEIPSSYGTLRITDVRIQHQVSRRAVQRSQLLSKPPSNLRRGRSYSRSLLLTCTEVIPAPHFECSISHIS